MDDKKAKKDCVDPRRSYRATELAVFDVFEINLYDKKAIWD